MVNMKCRPARPFFTLADGAYVWKHGLGSAFHELLLSAGLTQAVTYTRNTACAALVSALAAPTLTLVSSLYAHASVTSEPGERSGAEAGGGSGGGGGSSGHGRHPGRRADAIGGLQDAHTGACEHGERCL